MKKFLFHSGPADTLTSIGLLFLRLAIGLFMAIGHGWPKLAGFGEMAQKFPALFGLSPSMNLGLAVFAELFCSIAIVLGLLTRAAAIPLAITMIVAAVVVHGDDPWNKKEFALLYLIPYVTLMLTGAGKFSVDARLAQCGADFQSAAFGMAD